jgi:hypothetical protein
MNRREFCACDLQWRELRLPDLDGRADCIRDVNSITLRNLIVPSVERGRKISLARFDRRVLIPQINGFSSRAPVARLDRASDYGFKKGGLRGFLLCCTASQTLGNAAIRIRAALRRIAQFCSKNSQTVENDREK